MSNQPTDLAALVTGARTGRRLPPLGMGASDTERPFLIDGSSSLGSWVGRARFSGQGQPVNDEGTVAGQTQQVDIVGTFAATANSDRLTAIVSCETASAPAVWFTFARSRLTYATSGQEGLLKKRPKLLTISTGSSTLELGEVAQVFERSGRFQTGQIRSLLQVLEFQA